MNRALIDTDIISYFLKGDPVVLTHFEEYLAHFDTIEISLITYYEIMSGLLAKNASSQLNIFESFISQSLILPLTEGSVKISSEIYGFLRKAGNPLDDIDLLIAGVALENDLVLVTNNLRHFSRIPNLKTENWKVPIAN